MMEVLKMLHKTAVEHLSGIERCLKKREVDDMLAEKIHEIYSPQKFDWDCGLACCIMVLKWRGFNSERVYEHELALLASPLWTIDLLIVLKDCGVSGSMHTTCLGLQEHHSSLDWYSRGESNDSKRIAKQFTLARELGLKIGKDSMSLSALQSLLQDSSESVVILLVDNLTLEKRAESGKYRGHFIVLVAYEEFSDSFTYLDPAHYGLHTVDSTILEEARKHSGTDEDIIICSKLQSAVNS